MTSQVDVCNFALSILGKPPISSILDPANTARVLNVEYDMTRRALLMGPGTWRFSISRASLPQLTNAPVSGPFTTMYAQPADCLRILQVGMTYPGLDLSDYRLGPSDADYSLEGGNILCDYGAPLALVYVADVSNTTLFDANFVIYFASQLAYNSCERLTGSDAKQEAALKRRDGAKMAASASNAFLNPPMSTADDTWIAARMN